MVNLFYKKAIVSILLTIAFSLFCRSQNSDFNKLTDFDDYSNLGYSINPIFFNKAEVTRNSGDIVLENSIMPSFQLGAKYLFHKDKKVSFSTGIKVTLIPFINSYFELKQEDVFSGFNGYEEYTKEYGYLFLSIPIAVEYKKAITKKVIFNSSFGLDVFYLARSRNDFSIELISEELNESREVFAVYQETQDNRLQASAVLSAGVYFLLDKCLIQTNIVYNKNFQNLLEGEYQFGNLFVSSSTRGDYTVSGDYIGLSTTIHFKKRAKKKKKKN